MQIVFPLADLPDLFPAAPYPAKETSAIEDSLRESYSRIGVAVTVEVQGELVVITYEPDANDDLQRELDQATALAQEQEYGEARKCFQSLILRAPHDSELHRMYAQTFFEEGDAEAAKDALLDALRLDPENVHALVLMGNILMTLEKPEVARRYYDRAVTIDPENHLTLNNLGAVMAQAGRLSEARRYLELALEVEPDYPNTHYGLGLVDARSNHFEDAFRNAIEALKLSEERDRVRQPAIELALEAGRMHARDTAAEQFYASYLKAVEATIGKPIQVVPVAQLDTAAAVEVAEVHGRDHHLIKYKKELPTAAHLVAHELGHLELIATSRGAAKNMLFSSDERTREHFRRDYQKDLDKLVRRGLPVKSAEQFIDSLFAGLNRQIYNAPLDLFIEWRLHERLVALRPVQFRSLHGLLAEYIQAATSRDIRRMTPRRIFEANLIYNLTHALQMRDLFGLDLVADFRADRRLQRQADAFYEEYLEVRGDLQPGEEYEFVQDWAKVLRIDSYFRLIEEDSYLKNRSHENSAHQAEDVLKQIERDPLNLGDANRSESGSQGNTLSFRDSPAGTMAVTMYLVDAIKLLEGREQAFVQEVAYEVAMLGNYGLDPSDSEKKYQLKSVPGKSFSALHLLAYMYAAFRVIDPNLDTELDFHREYEQAKLMARSGM